VTDRLKAEFFYIDQCPPQADAWPSFGSLPAA